MKRKNLFLALAALLAGGAFWLARSTGGAADEGGAPEASAGDLPVNTASVSASSASPLETPGQLAPPVPNRRFTEFTPEQRVEFARKGHGPGG